MFCLPDIQARRKLLGGPLSHRQYNNDLFLKLTTPPAALHNNEPRLLKLSRTNRVSERLRSMMNKTGLEVKQTDRDKPSGMTTQRTTARSNKEEKVLPYVTVFLADLITSYEQIKQKIVVLDLEKYFETYFKKTLKGEFTLEFYQRVDKYLRQLDEASPRGVRTAHNITLPIELVQISTKKEFLGAISDLEKKGER